MFEREADGMIGLARLLCRDPNDVEDVVMDAFAAVVERHHELRNPGGFLRSAVVNGARRRARTADNRRRIRDHNVPLLIPSHQIPPEQHFIDEMLESLSEREHTAVVLVHYAGYTYSETADLMDEPTGTIKALVSRALRRLRDEVQPA